MLEHLDTEAVLLLNGLVRNHYWIAKAASGLALNPIARGVPVFVPLIVLWFTPDHVNQRGRMVLGLLAACFATFVSVILQKHLHVDIRPFFNPQLHLYQPNYVDPTVWDRINSFPSDTATLYFALSTVVFLEWRAAGIVAYAWSFITAGVCRAALGFHYPSDIAAGIVLGAGTVYLITQIPRIAGWIQLHLENSVSRKAWIHAALFLLLADAYSQFEGLQGVMRLLTKLGHAG